MVLKTRDHLILVGKAASWLALSWQNGNRKYVAEQLLKLGTVNCILVLIEMQGELPRDDMATIAILVATTDPTVVSMRRLRGLAALSDADDGG